MSAADHIPEMQHVLGRMQAEVLEVNVANGWFDGSRTFGDEIALQHSEISEALEAFREGMSDEWLSWKVPVQVMLPDSDGVFSLFKTHAVVKYEEDDPCVPFMVERYGIGKPEGVPSEVADQLVRLLDFCERQNIDLATVFAKKLAFNRTRGFKHGGKAI